MCDSTNPECLGFAVVDVFVQGNQLSALMDPGSSLSYVNEKTAHLSIRTLTQNVSMTEVHCKNLCLAAVSSN